MHINSLPVSQVTEAAPSLAPVVPAKAVPPKAEEPKKAGPKEVVKEPVKETAKETPKAPEITDVKPAGENAEGEPTFTLKVNGKEVKATQSEILALAQKARGAEEAMKAKAEIEKLTSSLLENLDKDAYGVLVRRHGKEKAKEIAINMVKNLIAEEAKDPKDIELEDLRARAKESDAEKERAKKEQEQAALKVKQQELYRTMLTEIDKELSETHLPKDRLTLTRVLNYLSAGKKANGQNWTIREAVKAVEVEDMGHASYYAKQYVEGKLPSEKFREILGDDAFKKLNKEQINILKDADKLAKKEAGRIEQPAVEAPPRKRSLSKSKGSQGISEREWRKTHGSLGGI